MKSRKRKILKLGIMCLMPLLALLITISNSYAYYLNSDGNIQSNNLLNWLNYYGTDGSNYYYEIQLESNTITLSSSNNFGSGSDRAFAYKYNIDDPFTNWSSYTSPVVMNVPSNYNTIYFAFKITAENVMINYGSTALPYELYGLWISQNNVEYNNSLLANMGLLQYLGYMQITNTITNEDIEINGINEFTKEYLIDNQLISSSGVLNLNYFNTNALNPNYNPYKITFYFDSNIPLNLFNLAFQTYSSGTMTLVGNGTYIIQISSDILSYDSNLINDTTLTYIDEIVINFDSTDALSNINFNSYSIINYNNGYNYGYNVGDNVGYQRGYNEGDNVGYQRGYNEGIEQDFEDTGFKTLITTILSYPVNMVRESLNFEFMGIHVASIVLFIVSLGIVAFVIKRFKD